MDFDSTKEILSTTIEYISTEQLGNDEKREMSIKNESNVKVSFAKTNTSLIDNGSQVSNNDTFNSENVDHLDNPILAQKFKTSNLVDTGFVTQGREEFDQVKKIFSTKQDNINSEHSGKHEQDGLKIETESNLQSSLDQSNTVVNENYTQILNTGIADSDNVKNSILGQDFQELTFNHIDDVNSTQVTEDSESDRQKHKMEGMVNKFSK